MRRVTAVAVLAVSIFATSYGPVGDGGRFGAGGGAVCGTDAQCAAYSREVLHETPDGYGAAVSDPDDEDGETA